MYFMLQLCGLVDDGAQLSSDAIALTKASFGAFARAKLEAKGAIAGR